MTRPLILIALLLACSDRADPPPAPAAISCHKQDGRWRADLCTADELCQSAVTSIESSTLKECEEQLERLREAAKVEPQGKP